MEILERLEHWFNCRKIELSHWLENSSFRYSTWWNEESGTYQSVKVSPVVKAGTPEWDQQQAEYKEIQKSNREREAKLCALDPAYKARSEKMRAKREALYAAELEKLDPETRRVIELQNARRRAASNQ